jgi:hypothetical protein
MFIDAEPIRKRMSDFLEWTNLSNIKNKGPQNYWKLSFKGRNAKESYNVFK